MAIPICIEVPLPPEPPKITMLQFGVLEKARESLYSLPDPSRYLLALQDQLAVALMPVRQFLEMLEMINAIVACILAVKDAISKLSPGPLISCFGNLLEAFMRLLQWIPPIPYIKIMLDVMGFALELINEVVLLFVVLDNKIGEYRNALAAAADLSDLSMESTLTCAQSEIRALAINGIDAIRLIKPLIDVLMNSIGRLVPSSELQDAVAKYNEVSGSIGNLKSAIASGPAIPTGLGTIVTVMASMTQAIATLHNTLAPIVGRAKIVPAAMPTFRNI